jgi:hypothetical protein
MRRHHVLALLIAIGGLAAGGRAAEVPSRPNVVLILADNR